MTKAKIKPVHSHRASGRQNKTKKNKWRLNWPAIFLIILAVVVFLYFGCRDYYEQRFFSGIRVAGLDLGTKTKDQAREILEKKLDNFSEKGLNFVYQNQKINITPIISASSGPDLSYKIIEFKLDQTLEKALVFGREDSGFNNLKRIVRAYLQKKNFDLDFELNQPELKTILRENFQQFEIKTQPARLDFSDNEINIIPEKNGLIFDYEAIIIQAQKNLAQLDQTSIELKLIRDQAQITVLEAQKNLDWAQEILNLTPITLKYQEQTWSIDKNLLSSFLELRINQDSTRYEKGRIILGIKPEEFKQYLRTIAETINIMPQDAKFILKDGKVAQFQASVQGIELDLEKNYQQISQEVILEKKNQVDLITKILPAQVTTENVNDLGIKELIGVGRSNFAGSPVNRRHNIAVGAASLNGLLIKPEEEFSLLKALGEVDAEHGYKTELVIKGSKTIPEFGGGLCQIGTTAFRVALNAGLPITARQNHSYRVSYYEPAGTDATIYDPSPDLKFINDTGHSILFLTKIEGDNLIFEFWGTKDGRLVEQFPDPPKIYDIKAPSAAKIIETEDLPVGQKKCTEKAHKGATTEFTYRVAYPNGEIKTKLFKSVYVPWQEVCLVGVEKTIGPSADIESDQTASPGDVEVISNTNINVQSN